MTDKREQTANVIDLVANPADTERHTADITDKVVQSHQGDMGAQDETIGVAKAIEPAARRKVGRPTNYKPEFVQALEGLGSEGLSETSMAVRIGLDRQTMRGYADPNHASYVMEFSAALAREKEISQDWWEEEGRKSLHDRTFQGNVWQYVLNNRFGRDYQARPELATGNVQINIQVSAEDESVT